MRNTARGIFVALVALSMAWASVAGETLPLETHLNTFARQLQLAMTLSSVAIHSPSLQDLHTNAQLLINFIEGVGGRHFVRPEGDLAEPDGLSHEFSVIRQHVERTELSAEARSIAFTAAKNVRTYLDFALSAALRCIDQRRRELATLDMMQSYAFLAAAYGEPCDVPYVPALWTLLIVFDLDNAAPREDG